VDAVTELFSFQGRANRAWYFWHTFLDGAVIFALILALLVVATMIDNPAMLILPVLGAILGGAIAAIAVTVKRLHDLDRPGWHWFLLAVPLYNIYLALVLLFKRGTWGGNQFGPDPLERFDRYIEG
jgi:uncharacterized membrane protein YhaH (DUF805 family)